MGKANTSDAAKKAAAEKAVAEAAAKKAAAEKAAAEKAAAAAAAAAANQLGATKTIKVPALSVVSNKEGFRRGGRAWGKEASVVKLSALSKEEIAQIKGEARLTVTEVEVDEEVAAE